MLRLQEDIKRKPFVGEIGNVKISFHGGDGGFNLFEENTIFNELAVVIEAFSFQRLLDEVINLFGVEFEIHVNATIILFIFDVEL